MVKATLIHQNKFFIKHGDLDTEAVVELKIWEVPISLSFPDVAKYSLFCVNRDKGEIVIGFDNHHPKGPHVHFGDIEMSYEYIDNEKLLEDFFIEIRKKGYNV